MGGLILLVLWAVCGVVGYMLGETKGRPGQGAVLGVLLGPIGWLCVLLGRDYSKREEDKVFRNVAPTVPRTDGAVRTNEGGRIEWVSKLRIAKDGTELGEMDIPSVKLHIKTGQLTAFDYYYDSTLGDWHTLDVCPALLDFWQS